MLLYHFILVKSMLSEIKKDYYFTKLKNREIGVLIWAFSFHDLFLLFLCFDCIHRNVVVSVRFELGLLDALGFCCAVCVYVFGEVAPLFGAAVGVVACADVDFVFFHDGCLLRFL